MQKESETIKLRLQEAKNLSMDHPERMAIINQWESELRRCIRMEMETEEKLATANII